MAPNATLIGQVRLAEDRTGLRAGTPIVAGSADHIASALASGLRDDGDTLIKFGGAGDILFCASQPLTHPKLFIDTHDIPGKYLLNGCMAASGSLVKWWVADILGGVADKATLRAMDEAALALPPGSDGLVVLPYFLGEKTPLMDPEARGLILGLMLHHSKHHIFRAMLEAVAGINLPAAGFVREACSLHHELVPLTWCSAQPSGKVTRDAYERVSALLLEDLRAHGAIDAVYLDLHGAMVAEHLDDADGDEAVCTRKRGARSTRARRDPLLSPPPPLPSAPPFSPSNLCDMRDRK